MKLKAKFFVLHENPDQAKPLLSLLKGHGIRYTQGYKEQVPHPKERWVIPEFDYAVPWAVQFRVPEALRTDLAFVQRLDEFCPCVENWISRNSGLVAEAILADFGT